MQVIPRVLVLDLGQLRQVLEDLRVAVYLAHLAEVLVNEVHLNPIAVWQVEEEVTVQFFLQGPYLFD